MNTAGKATGETVDQAVAAIAGKAVGAQIGHDLILHGEVDLALAVGEELLGQGVVGDQLQMIRDGGVPQEIESDLVAEHPLHHGAGLVAVQGVDTAAHLVAVGHAVLPSRGHVDVFDALVVDLRVMLVPRDGVHDGEDLEALLGVDDVVGTQPRLLVVDLFPVEGLLVEELAQVKEGLVSRLLIEPQHREDIVSAADSRPGGQLFGLQRLGLPGKVVLQEGDHPRVFRGIVVLLQRHEHGHQGPVVQLVGVVCQRAEGPALHLTLKRPVDPLLGLGLHVVIIQYVGRGNETAGVVGASLPIFARAAQPARAVIALGLAVGRECFKLFGYLFGLEEQLVLQPTCGLYLPKGKR